METRSVEITCTIDVKPGEKLSLPASLIDGVGPGRWCVSVRRCDVRNEDRPARCHDAFLNSYAPQDEGLYDDLGR
ncbi:MAG TPA: hypothetical protein VFW87_23960 [Pirellulales bacterium]|nr:hypothetical protein [Pirellulales bacterium]